MKKQLSIMLSLLAAGSMGMTQAQELLFTAPLQDKLAELNEIQGEIAPLTSQNKTIGFLIWAQQQGYREYTRSLTIFSPEGKALQTIPTNTKYNTLIDLEFIPFGDGGFCVIAECEEYDNYNLIGYGYEYIFYTYSNGTWNEKQRIIVDDIISDDSAFPNLANPTATFALFKEEGDKVVVEVYVANKQTLTPAPLPAITSDLSELAAKRGKAITPYATTTNFQTTGFSAVGLPAGLSIDPVSGVISGKTSAKGVFNVLLVVSQAGGQPVVATKRISVK
jgi:hypothetical protein